jgi:hypothetical protein
MTLAQARRARTCCARRLVRRVQLGTRVYLSGLNGAGTPSTPSWPSRRQIALLFEVHAWRVSQFFT